MATITTLTPAQKLTQVGKTQLATNASLFGTVDVGIAVSETDVYKREARYMATQEQQLDVNGLGYQYQATNPEFES